MCNPYSKIILPKITDWVCGARNLDKQRNRIVPQASGVVLEIGFGSGHNLPFYNAKKVTKVIGLEPSLPMIKLADKRINSSPFEVITLHEGAEKIHLPNDAVESVVFTFTLCTIRDVMQSLSEMERVLRPGGKIYFCEHGLAPERGVRRFQHAFNPLWKRLSGGCNLNRNIPLMLSEKFDLKNLDSGYIPGLKFGSYHYWGVAEHKISSGEPNESNN
jgi:SAM-dependent methyltransferase